MSAQILLPARMHIGGGAVRTLPAVLDQLAVRHPLLVTDPAMVALGHAALIEALLADAGIPLQVFDDTEQEPSSASIERGVDAFRSQRFDALIALGGGSVIDSAKAIGVLAHHGGRMRDFAVPNDTERSEIPLIAIPTTAGTGSEATRFTVITDSQTQEKMLCRGSAYLPAVAIVDYEFTLTAPARLSADTGIDALTHAIEAYVSRRASPFTDDMALAAMSRLARNIERVCSQPGDRDAREAMMLGALQAGIAFSNASVCLVHGMSRPVGALFHVPHGLSNAMLLPTVTRFSAVAAPERYARCCHAMGWCDVDAPVEAAIDALVDGLEELNRRLEVPGPKRFGIARDAWFEALERMAVQAEASGSPANNPRIPSRAEMIALYTEVWGNA